MIYLAINVFFNALILGLVFLISGFFLKINLESYWAWIIGYLIAGGLTIIGYTKFATDIVGLFMPGRKMIGREREQLEPLFRDIIARTNTKYHTNYSYDKFKIRVSDNKVINAFALGHRNLTINKGCFTTFNDNQLKAILAHELGHIYNGDSVHSIALIFSSFGTRVVMWLYAIFTVIHGVFIRIMGGVADGSGASSLAMMISFVPILFFLPVIILNWLGSKVFYFVNMLISRKAEYRADKFVASLGLKADMVEALEIFDNITSTDNSFMYKLMATHPTPMQRIGALEDGKDTARENIKSRAIPYTSGREVLKLSSLIIVIGIMWCGYQVYDYKQYASKPKILAVYKQRDMRQVASDILANKRTSKKKSAQNNK